MDIYILDDSLRRTETVEQYQSMIWTERYSAYGDFELVIDPDIAEPSLFSVGTRLAIAQSDRIMTVDTTERAEAEDGVEKLTIKGKSLEDVLNQRLNRVTVTFPPTPVVLGPGLPADLVRTLFHSICRTNAVVPENNIPFIQSGTISPASGIPEPTDTVSISVEVEPLYDTIKKIADVYHMGFRLRRNGDTSMLYFEIFMGSDRTTQQLALAPVVFSPQMDNLTDTSELKSTALLKNVAIVVSANGVRTVLAEGIASAPSGFDRRVMYVQADDITLAAGVPLNAALDQRGKEELAKNRVVIGFDGEISQTSYTYGIHYNLGDLVTKRGADGNGVNMKVVEQIFVSDAEGDRSYPTLAVDTLLVAGSWDAVAPNKTWNDYTTETWNTV
jgi:hypothetical protein